MSEMAKAVAMDVIAAVGKGVKVNKTEIHKKHGYSDTSAHSHKAIQTKDYQNMIEPVLERMVKLRDKMMKEMDERDLSDARLHELNTSVKDLTGQIQLLSGGETERQGLKIEIVNYADTLPISTKELPA